MNDRWEQQQQRLEHLEIVVSGMQRDYEQLNEVVLQQQARLIAIAERLKQFEQKSTGDEADLPHERPPHY